MPVFQMFPQIQKNKNLPALNPPAAGGANPVAPQVGAGNQAANLPGGVQPLTPPAMTQYATPVANNGRGLGMFTVPPPPIAPTTTPTSPTNPTTPATPTTPQQTDQTQQQPDTSGTPTGSVPPASTPQTPAGQTTTPATVGTGWPFNYDTTTGANATIPPEIQQIQPSTSDITSWVTSRYDELKKDATTWSSGKISLPGGEKIPLNDWMSMTPQAREMWVQDWFLKLSQAYALTNNEKVEYYTKALKQAGVPKEVIDSYYRSLQNMGLPGTTPQIGQSDMTTPVVQPISPLAFTALPGYLETDQMTESEARAAQMKNYYTLMNQQRQDTGAAQNFLLEELQSQMSDPVAKALAEQLAAQSSGQTKAISDEQKRLLQGQLTEAASLQAANAMRALSSDLGARNVPGSGIGMNQGAALKQAQLAQNLGAMRDVELAAMAQNTAYQQQGQAALANWIAQQQQSQQGIAGSIANMALGQPTYMAGLMPNLPNDIYMATEGNQALQDALNAQQSGQMYSSALGAIGSIGGALLAPATGGLSLAAIPALTGVAQQGLLNTSGAGTTYNPSSLYNSILTNGMQ